MRAPLPETFDEVHDFSAVDAATRAKDARSKARVILASGAAALLLGAGVGAGAFGLSYLIAPRIAWCGSGDQICIGESIGPHLTGPAGVQGIAGQDGKDGRDGRDGKDGIAGKPGRDGADGQNGKDGKYLTVGQKATPEELKQSSAYQNAPEKHERIVSIRNGVILYSDGQEYRKADNGGFGRNINWNTHRYDGSPSYCLPTGRKNPYDQSDVYHCFAISNGVVAPLEVRAGEVIPWMCDVPPPSVRGNKPQNEQNAIDELFN